MRTLLFFVAVAAFGASPDTWQKSKECAAQAEKVVAEMRQPLQEHEKFIWSNHYSPKYNKCFLWIETSLPIGDRKVAASTVLEDAFERYPEALMMIGEAGQNCQIGAERAECATVKAFIAEHLTN